MENCTSSYVFLVMNFNYLAKLKLGGFRCKVVPNLTKIENVKP